MQTFPEHIDGQPRGARRMTPSEPQVAIHRIEPGAECWCGHPAIEREAQGIPPSDTLRAIQAIEHPCHDACVGDIHADCQCAAWVRQEAIAALTTTPSGGIPLIDVEQSLDEETAIHRIIDVIDNDEGGAELYEAALALYRARLASESSPVEEGAEPAKCANCKHDRDQHTGRSIWPSKEGRLPGSRLGPVEATADSLCEVLTDFHHTCPCPRFFGVAVEEGER